jgi:hypothetical protein
MSHSVFPRNRSTIEPCLPKPAKEPPKGPGWIHEIRHDGFRVLARHRADGLSYRKIAAELAARGHVTGSGKSHAASAVQKMVQAGN